MSDNLPLEKWEGSDLMAEVERLRDLRERDGRSINELARQVERLQEIRDTQRSDIEWLHERLREIVLLAQPTLRSDRKSKTLRPIPGEEAT